MSQTDHSIKMTEAILLVQNGLISVRVAGPKDGFAALATWNGLGTVLSNMAYYGYIPSKAATEELSLLDHASLVAFWQELEPALAYVTGSDRNMDEFVVYKNFPAEVLEMDQATYWCQQIAMYWGVPNEEFTQQPLKRAPLLEKSSFKVLDIAGDDAAATVWTKLCRASAGWTDSQRAQAEFLVSRTQSLEMADFTFRENGVHLVASRFAEVVSGSYPVVFETATDVLRLAAALSGGDVSLRRKTKFRRFSRPERRTLVSLISDARHLDQDFAMRKEQWKRLLSYLHPAEFGFSAVTSAYDLLYRGLAKTPAARVEAMFADKDVSVLSILKTRPGDFLRRLHKAFDIFGYAAFDAFKSVTDSLTVSQLLKLDGYLRTVNDRKAFIVPPRGKWAVSHIVENGKTEIGAAALADLRGHLSAVIGNRLDACVPDGFDVSPASRKVKLQSNGQELAAYGRGTVFDIPENMTYVRTASFWKAKDDYGNTWFDNGWNFFKENWDPAGSICWNMTLPFDSGAAVFSGDPTNSKDIEGRACQVIDLYLDKLVEAGVRYAVWNVLCYSHIAFSDAQEVLATLQWGEKAEEGEIYEPTRAQNVFPLTGDDMSKFVAYIDLEDRKLVYLDVAMRVSVSAADENEQVVGRTMSAFVEHLESLPSVADLFGHGKVGTVPVRYRDENEDIDGVAYVFQRLNTENTIQPLDVEFLLNATDEVLVDSVSA
jgi:hypothetical protein|nr:hypothetical protein [Neorhizobium tomejilense]